MALPAKPSGFGHDVAGRRFDSLLLVLERPGEGRDVARRLLFAPLIAVGIEDIRRAAGKCRAKPQAVGTVVNRRRAGTILIQERPVAGQIVGEGG